MNQKNKKVCNKSSFKVNHFLISFLVVAVFMFAACSIASADSTVSPTDPSADYSSIQDAIDASLGNGDTIIVWNGTYNENVEVNKSVNIVGNGSAWCHVIASSSSDHVFDVSVDDVNISGLNISGTTGIDKAGIFSSGNYAFIYNCSLTGNNFGICISYSNSHNITNNNVSSSSQRGIYLVNSNNCNIENNLVRNNGMGISLIRSNSNTIRNNTANNQNYGVWVYSSPNTICENNTLNANRYGIHLADYSNNSRILNNTILESATFGINIDSSSFNTVDNNTLNNGDEDGINLKSSSNNNTISNNTIQNNDQIGVEIRTSINNIIFNNYIGSNTAGNAYDNGTNYWNGSKQICMNVINGPFVGGNYWGDYSGNDTNGDGLGDTNYNISGGSNVDHYPLLYNLIVDDDFTSATPGWNTTRFDTIQKGVDNTTSLRNIVYIWNGTYIENINVANQISIVGNDSSLCYVQAADNDSHVLSVTVDNVNISGLNLTGANDSGRAGIHFQNADFCSVSSVISRENYYGVYYVAADNCTINNSHIRNNSYAGFYLTSGSNDNTISSNTVIYNDRDGTAGIGGFLVSNSNRILISNNNVSRNDVGIRIDIASQNCTTHNNTIINNTNYGIEYFTSADYGLITNNTVTGPTTVGIYLINSNFSTCKNNTVTDCTTGLQCSNAYNNTIFNNFFNNSINAVDNQENIWNTTKTLETNIIGGPYLGGNYFVDYGGIDQDHDGLGDTITPYNSTDSIQNEGDYRPLIYSPSVESTSPTNASTSISRSTNIVITFSKSMNQTTVQNNLSFSSSFSKSYSWNSNNTTLTINPSSDLSYSTTYTVTVGWNATDSSGNVMISNYSFSFTIRSSPSGGGGGTYVPPANHAPTADAGGPYTGVASSDILFDGSASSDPDLDTLTYAWDFGDNSTGSGAQPTHTYSAAGTYTVVLIVDDGETNDSDTTTATIAVSPDPPTNINDSDNDGYDNDMESSYGTNSTDESDNPLDTDGDGIPDEDSPDGNFTGDSDDDNDGICDSTEDSLGSNPKDPDDVVELPEDLGFLVDTNSDGEMDLFYDSSSELSVSVPQNESGVYLIDVDGDSKVDYSFDPVSGELSVYEDPNEDSNEGLPLYVIAIIIVVAIIIAFLILWKLGFIVIE